MDHFTMEKVEVDSFYTKVETREGELTLCLVGDMDMTYPGEHLSPFFNEFHEKVMSAGLKELVLNVEELTYINSSSIKVLLNWLMKVKGLAESDRYKIGMVYNKELTWQTSAFQALAVFAADCFYLKS